VDARAEPALTSTEPFLTTDGLATAASRLGGSSSGRVRRREPPLPQTRSWRLLPVQATWRMFLPRKRAILGSTAGRAARWFSSREEIQGSLVGSEVGDGRVGDRAPAVGGPLSPALRDTACAHSEKSVGRRIMMSSDSAERDRVDHAGEEASRRSEAALGGGSLHSEVQRVESRSEFEAVNHAAISAHVDAPLRLSSPVIPAMFDEPRVTQMSAGQAGDETFLMHPLDGSISCYQRLAQASQQDGSLYAIAFPLSLCTQLTTMEELAQSYMAALRGVKRSGPYRLGGYSFGGTLAFEIAIRLEDAGETVSQVIMLDSPPPRILPMAEPREQFFNHWVEVLESVVGVSPRFEADHPRPSDIEDLVALASRAGCPERLVDRYRTRLSISLHNHEILGAYCPHSTCSATLIYLEATNIDRGEVDLYGSGASAAKRWRRHFRGAASTHHLPVGHHSMFRDRKELSILAAAYDAALHDPAGIPVQRDAAAPGTTLN
jgi:thioesterase domain-containing protein